MSPSDDVLAKQASGTDPRKVEAEPAPEADHDDIQPIMPFMPGPEGFMDEADDPLGLFGDDELAWRKDGVDEQGSLVASLGTDLSVVVIGASGSIGAALTMLLQNDPAVSRIYAFSRSGSVPLGDKIAAGHVDLAQERSIQRAAMAVEVGGPVSLVIVATGYLDQSELDSPFGDWSKLDAMAMTSAFQVNAVGPAFVAKHFLPRMRSDHKSVFAVVTDRHLDPANGAHFSYDASKAALNSVIRGLSDDLGRQESPVVCVGLYPGVVDTPFSEPLRQDEETDELPLAPDFAAERLLRIVNGAELDDGGKVLSWDGEVAA